MAGIYIHIPFCKKACHYCNFHFSTSFGQKEALVSAIIREIALRKDYLEGAKINTIYFGGGTPSVLASAELEQILQEIYKCHTVDNQAEVTLEANPDDLSKDKLVAFKELGINRLSIGIQSFHETDLLWMNRSHNALQARQCIEQAMHLGLDDISIDLIFGSNTTTTKMWEENLLTAVSYQLPHLSCYGLTVEEGTALAHHIKTNKTGALNNKLGAEQFELTNQILCGHHYEHYEISNYALDNKYSKHNTNYWKQVPYLGIGPAAHSYDGIYRQWNIAHNKKYIDSLNDNELPATKEKLSKTDRFNEYLMTGLRAMWGCELKQLTLLNDNWPNLLTHELKQLQQDNLISLTTNELRLTEEGKLVGDRIISQLFLTD